MISSNHLMAMESRSNLVESKENQVHDNNHNGVNTKQPSSNSSSIIGFECNICLDLAKDPIVTLCGHLFCRPCLYDWLQNYSTYQECPACKAVVKEETLISLYRGNTSVHDPHRKPILANRFGQSNHQPWIYGMCIMSGISAISGFSGMPEIPTSPQSQGTSITQSPNHINSYNLTSEEANSQTNHNNEYHPRFVSSMLPTYFKHLSHLLFSHIQYLSNTVRVLSGYSCRKLMGSQGI